MLPLIAKVIFRARATATLILVGLPRKTWWRACGMSLGHGTRLGKIHVTWPHQVGIGTNCVLEHGTYLKFDGVYQPGPSIRIGDDVFIGANCEFNIRAGITVGSNTLIASNCYCVDHDHGHGSRDLPMNSQDGGAEAAIVLADDVWIGANVVVLKGVTVGRGAIVGAGSVVACSVPPYEIWAGVPARKVRDRP